MQGLSRTPESMNVPEVKQITFQLLLLTNAVSSTLILLVGLVSWIALRKFRTFGNYVFLNTVLASLLFFVLPALGGFIIVSEEKDELIEDCILVGVLSFIISSFNCWLSICCVMFYVQTVQVFGANVTRRYLKAALCGWLAPALIALLSIIITITLNAHPKDLTSQLTLSFVFLMIIGIIFCPLLVNVYMYVKVMLALMKSRTVETKRRVQMATLVFVMSGSLFLVSIINAISANRDGTNPNTNLFIFCVILFIQGLLINILFLMLKSNWILWCQVCRRQRTIVTNQPTPV